VDDYVTIEMEGDVVRFTPHGRIAVIDAIGALCEAESPRAVWEDLKRSRPRIEAFCEEYVFSDGDPVPVADAETWTTIEMMLLDHIVDSHH
jgi:hypothetical protein